MGLFDGVVADRKDDKIVTKTVQGKNTEVGRRKIELIEEMRSQGYELVNEISESGVVEGYFGNTTPGTRYTLTFRYSEELAERVRIEEEERRKKEEEERKRQEEARLLEQEKKDKKDQLRKEEHDRVRDALGHGWCIRIEGGKPNAKAMANAAKELFSEKRYFPYKFKMQIKDLKKRLIKKQYALELYDYGEFSCRYICKRLNDAGVAASAVAYDENETEAQKITDNWWVRNGVFSEYLHQIVHTISFFRSEYQEEVKNTLYEKMCAAEEKKEV